MNKVFKVLAAVAACVFAAYPQSDNYNGWGDTSRVLGLYGDTTVWSGPIRMMAFANLLYSAYARDTSAAGFASDSLSFEWGIQCGHPSWRTTSGMSKVYEWGPKVVLDTFSTLNLANFTDSVESRVTIDVNGIPVYTRLLVDSSTVSGWAYQTYGPNTPRDVYFRFWAHGMAGNLKSRQIELVFQVIRQYVYKTGN